MSNGTPMCSSAHCSGVSKQINDTCKKNSWPLNHLVLVCNPVTGECCNCTCSCLAYNTPVLIPNSQQKLIQDFKIGDLVIAFNPDGTSAPHPVEFSNGTGPTSVQPEMVHMEYGMPDGTVRTIIVTLDHTFLRPDGRLIRASMVRPGFDLKLADGSTTSVSGYEVKGYTGGVWNIATSTGEPTSLDGHLLDTHGILSGDYAVQLYYSELSGTGLATDASETPEVTTSGYDAAAGPGGLPAAQPSPPTLPVVDFLATHTGPTNRLTPGGRLFLHHDHSFVLEVPVQPAIQGYLTEAQAAEVSANLQPTTERTVAAMTETRWLATLFNAFYPDITIIIDAPNRSANAYSFHLGAESYILLQGGLIRARPLGWQGIALILAYSVGRFAGGPPLGPGGLTCKPEADYSVIGVLNKVFYPLYPNMIFEAYNQIQALFADISDKLDNPAPGCHETTLDCRIETYSAAMQYLDLPACAGGPPPNFLDVISAEGSLDGTATVLFSDFVNVTTAQDAANYSLVPAVTVTDATVTPEGTKVKLTGNFVSQTQYEVTVSNVLSIIGEPLNPAQNSAQFTMP